MEKIFFVCHGKTELLFVEYIASLCRVPVEFIAKKSGRSSIQINMLNTTLAKEIDRGVLRKANLEEYDIVYVLILMDLDELRPMEDGSNLLYLEDQYKDGTLLTNDEQLTTNPKIKYIVYFNDKNMEDVLSKTDITVPEVKRDIQKIFPLDQEEEVESTELPSDIPIIFQGIHYVREQFRAVGEEITTVPALIDFIMDRRKII